MIKHIVCFKLTEPSLENKNEAARVLRSAVAVQRYNRGMAVLLVVSVWVGMFS